MFEETILRALTLGPKSISELYTIVEQDLPGQCGDEPCLHRVPEFDSDPEWRHQVRTATAILSSQGRIREQAGRWQLYKAPHGLHQLKNKADRKHKVQTIDLTTQYMGLTLGNPLVVSACPLTGQLDVLRRLEEQGAAAAVMPSLFEEQLEPQDRAPDQLKSYAASGTSDSLYYYRELWDYNRGPEAYLRHIEDSRHAVSIPIIGSLNASNTGKWLPFAKRIEEAGADALELNICFLATSPTTTSEEVEERCANLVAEVRGQIDIPLAVKIGPYFTAIPHLAHRLVKAGADGLVLFNRFLHPDIDPDTRRVAPELSLSSSQELPMRLRWLAILRGRLSASLAVTGGVHTGEDVIKAILAGADVVMFASTLYRNGIDHMGSFVPWITDWLKANDYESIQQVRGLLSQARCPDPSAFERANYTKAISSFAGS